MKKVRTGSRRQGAPVQRQAAAVLRPESTYCQELYARRLIGQVVCVGLQDGSYYVGKVMGVRNGELVLAGAKGRGKLKGKPHSRADQAKVSGLLGSLLGGGGGGGLGGLGSMLGGGGGGGLGGLGSLLGGGGLGGLGSMLGGGGLGGLGGLLGGGGAGAATGAGAAAGAGAGAGGLGGMLGMVGRFWPVIRMGFGAVKFIAPMIGKFFK